MWMSRGPALQRVDEQDVRELDDRRGVGRLAEVAEVDLVVLGLDRLDVGLGVGHRVDVDLGEAADRGHVVDGEAGRVHDLLEAAAARGPVARPPPTAAACRAAARASASSRSSFSIASSSEVSDATTGSTL